jgi:eukaryotic-like serine/threonine-protein kinase
MQAGTQVGQYQIIELIGSGGMGEVYRARDTRLRRDVALKVLPERFSEDEERLSRFTREAQLLASLNHPNIAAIYGIEQSAGRMALVLEYVQGDTLGERIRKGVMPTGEALRVALQIAEALEAAHGKTVIHRDLKPANIKITPEGVVKVLDFGLAKMLGDEPTAASDLSESPTVLSAATGGILLGTPGYMAPEQVRGKPADSRADIWAFGIVLSEVLSARRMFEGETVGDTLAKILEREPDWNQLPAATPAPVRKLLERCLKKNPKERLQAIGDARTLLQEWIAHPESLAERWENTAYPLWTKILIWAAAPLMFAAGFFLRTPSGPPAPAVSQFQFSLPAGQALTHNYRHAVELSPDGRRIAFVANTLGPPAQRQLYVRTLDQWDAVAIPGTERAQNPFFSPDGQWLGFQQGQQIRKVAIAGGTPTVLVENLNVGQGADWATPGITWGKNGAVVFAKALGTGLSVVPDTGGEPQEFTTLNAEAAEASHRLPHFLPDGSGVLFTVIRFSTVTPDWKRAQVWVKSIKTGERKLLIENAMDARYVDGALIFARQAKLFAVRFDLATLSVAGTPVAVLDGVTHSLYGNAAITWTGAAQFSVAENGSLFYAPGSIEPPLLSSLVWIDRSGNATPITGMRPTLHFAARVSPDGKRIGFGELYVNKDIWVFDIARGTEDRATYEGQNAFSIWSPDGARMAFRSDRTGPLRIYLTTDANARNVVDLTMGPFDVPSSWTPDGKTLLFTRGFSATGGNTDIYAVSVDAPNKVQAVVATPASESFPELSPDGKWLAFCSDETGRPELYVQPYPGPGKRVTITSEGAQDPAWSKNSNELFYRSGNRMMSVRFKASDEFMPDKPIMLFQQPSLGGGTTVRATYDVAPDGRFLFNQQISEPAQERAQKIFPSVLRFVLNWTEATQRLLVAPH